MKPSVQTLICCLTLFACGDEKTKGTSAQSSNSTDSSASLDPTDSCDSSVDSDGDGIDDCTETEQNLDPSNEDSDGDGISDGMEVDCDTDPLDSAESCYTCGWGKNNPGSIETTGAEIGDIMDNISLVDQCGDMVDFYDLSGEYHILYMTTAG